MIKPTVSVVMITYGHEDFIEEAINSVLMQQCDFNVELIIANDCSPDKTDNVIQNIFKTHPNSSWIRYIRHKENIGMMPNFIFALKEAQGKYIALCEGDDYWTDPQKLQKQVDFLEQNPDCSLSFHSINKVDSQTRQTITVQRNDTQSRYFEMADLILGGGGFMGTQSMVLRKVVIEEIPEFFLQSPAGDYPLVLLLGNKGTVHYRDEVMASYRVNNADSAMAQVYLAQFSKIMDRYGKFGEMLYAFNEFSDHKYETWTKKMSSNLLFHNFRIFRLKSNITERRKCLLKWKDYLSFKHKIFAFLLILPIPSSKDQLRNFIKRT